MRSSGGNLIQIETIQIKVLILFENRRRDVISLNQPRGMSAKMAMNGCIPRG